MTMSSATERHKRRVQALINTPIVGADGQEYEVFEGETSDDVKTYLPLAAGLVSELTATQLKKKEEDDKKKAAANSEAGKAASAAADAQKKAAMASADAMTEADPNGPKHRAAAQLAVEAQAAAQKSAYFQSLAAAAAMPMVPGPGGQMVPANMMQAQQKDNTLLYVGIGVGVLALLGIVVAVARK
jgi:hypothetical protein